MLQKENEIMHLLIYSGKICFIGFNHGFRKSYDILARANKKIKKNRSVKITYLGMTRKTSDTSTIPYKIGKQNFCALTLSRKCEAKH